jgi:hypothetical protein
VQVIDEDGARIRSYGVTETNMVVLIKREGFWQCDAAILSYGCLEEPVSNFKVVPEERLP